MGNFTYFVSAIDTDSGKSIITGLLGKYFFNKGYSTLTQKLAQTGCVNKSDDLVIHQKISGIQHDSNIDIENFCPYIFKFPASPHLSAELENVKIKKERLIDSISKLQEKSEILIIEGVGGLYVPLSKELMVIDIIEEQNFHLILVSSAKLGAINHTLLSIEICKMRNVNLELLVYNRFLQENKIIADDNIKVIRDFLLQKFPFCKIIEIDKIDIENPPIVNFGL